MSDTFTATAQALGSDPDLRAKVMSAGSAEERAGILRDAGVAVPSHADVNSSLADVAGAGIGTTTGVAIGSAAAAAGA